MSHRLFTAIRPPASIRDALTDIMHSVDNARWQDDAQLHLTLRYIGDVEAHLADDLAEQLANVRFKPFELTVAGIGHFEDKAVPRAVWAALRPSEELERLQRKIEQVCQRAGLKPESRTYLPHITLARLNTSSGPIVDFMAGNSALALPAFTVEEFVLYESELHDDGSIYTPAVHYPAIRP